MPSTDTPTRLPTDLRDAAPQLRLLARWFDLRDRAHGSAVIANLGPHEHTRCKPCDEAAEQVAVGDEVQRDLRAWAAEIDDLNARQNRILLVMVLAVALGWLVGLAHAALAGWWL